MRGQDRRHNRIGILASLVGAGVALMIVGMAAQQQGGGQAAGGGRGGGGNNFANNFTGKITVGETSAMRMSRIKFEAGARTNWHLHATGQLLLVEEGKGRVYEVGGQIVDLPMGKPYYTQPNVLHWHGAAPDSPATQFSVYSGSLEWKEAVTDDEYTGKKKR
jgi:quercetin dioxygenase-like cupin family protein